MKSKILFETEMMQFIIKTLKEKQQTDQLTLISSVLDEIHIDDNIDWTLKDIDWNI